MRPKKSLGQNFLIDPNYKRKIVESLQIEEGDTILEIGPGRGVLTDELVERCQYLWIIEKDKELAKELTDRFQKNPRVKIFAEDFLETDLLFLRSGGHPERKRRIQPQKGALSGLNHLDSSPFDKLRAQNDSKADKIKAVGNLPYNVASQIFIKLIENRKHFSDFFLMFQKEMALRFVAKPGTKDYGLLTLWSTIYTDCKILFHLPPTVFRPRPKVSSSFVRFKIKEKPLLDDSEANFFWKLMRTLFQQRRKTIQAVLRKTPGVSVEMRDLASLQLTPGTRAETLSAAELIELARNLMSG